MAVVPTRERHLLSHLPNVLSVESSSTCGWALPFVGKDHHSVVGLRANYTTNALRSLPLEQKISLISVKKHHRRVVGSAEEQVPAPPHQM